jgi:hypothetical protein
LPRNTLAEAPVATPANSTPSSLTSWQNLQIRAISCAYAAVLAPVRAHRATARRASRAVYLFGSAQVAVATVLVDSSTEQTQELNKPCLASLCQADELVAPIGGERRGSLLGRQPH